MKTYFSTYDLKLTCSHYNNRPTTTTLLWLVQEQTPTIVFKDSSLSRTSNDGSNENNAKQSHSMMVLGQLSNGSCTKSMLIFSVFKLTTFHSTQSAMYKFWAQFPKSRLLDPTSSLTQGTNTQFLLPFCHYPRVLYLHW